MALLIKNETKNILISNTEIYILNKEKFIKNI